MRAALLAALGLLSAVSGIQAQQPRLPRIGRDWIGVVYPKAFYTPSNEVTFGLYLAEIRVPGFADDLAPPYRAALSLDGEISTTGSHKLQLDARLPNFARGWRFLLSVATERAARFNYFGIGNNTEYDNDNVNDAQPFFYRADFKQTFARGEVQRRIVSGLRILGGFHVERWSFDPLEGPSVLANDQATGVAPTAGASVLETTWRIGLVFDTRDEEVTPYSGVLLQAIYGAADSTVAGDVSFTRGTVSATGYLGIGGRLVLAGRVLGQNTSGSPQLGSLFLVDVSDNAFTALGGAQSHRALRTNRFIGEDLLLGNVEARYSLIGPVHSAAGAHVLLFLDVGRVFSGTEEFELTFDDMQVGGGAGLFVTLGRTALLGGTVGIGDEGVRILGHTKWSF